MGINVILLGAGYGTRLERDVLNCSDEDREVCKLIAGLPKALLPVGGKSLIARWIDLLDETGKVDQYYLVTNDKYHEQFHKFCEAYGGKISLLNDGTKRNEDRMGAVASINFAIEKFVAADNDILVVGGDTLLYDDFSIYSFIKEFEQHKLASSTCSLVTTYQCRNEDTIKYGILEVNSCSMKVESFLEKPKADETTSRSACPCFYLFSSPCRAIIEEFLDDHRDAPLKEKDATGNLIKYLIAKCNVFTFPISGRFDVGGLQLYKDCDAYFSKCT